jgi:hypothetical protein
MYMKIKPYLLYSISFFLFVELSFSLKYFNENESSITPREKLDLKFKKNQKSILDKTHTKIFLIGDSYFDYPSLKENSYDFKFTKWTSNNEFKFINLSQSGTKVEDHFSVLSKIPDNSNNIYIISYKPVDIFREIFEGSRSISLNTTKSFHLKKTIINTHTFQFFISILHQVSMKLLNEPLFLSSTWKSIIDPRLEMLNQLNEFLKILNDKSGRVIMVVNYPFNFKYDLNKISDWKLYAFFKNIDLDIKILQTPDITNKTESISWRNDHPNQKSVKEIFKQLVFEIEHNPVK